MCSAGRNRLVHDGVVYSTPEQFLDAMLPFIRDGLAQAEPILAAPTPANAALLQRELGSDAARIEWAEAAEDHRAVQRLGIFERFIADRVDRGATRVRLLGEPVWPSDPADSGTTEWQRYESYLNVALAPYPAWLVCPYDATSLSQDIVASACQTHPHIGHGSQRRASGEYAKPDDFARELDESGPLPAPPPEAAERCFDLSARIDLLADLRRFVGEQARAAEAADEQVSDVELAANEIAGNGARHADGLVTVRTWSPPGEFVCELSDTGPGIGDRFAGYATPQPAKSGGWGLWIARRVCDTIEIRSSAAGTTVRLHARLR